MILKAPDDMLAVSVDGKEYIVDEKGLVDVPEGHAAELFHHGLTIPEPPKRKKKVSDNGEPDGSDES